MLGAGCPTVRQELWTCPRFRKVGNWAIQYALCINQYGMPHGSELIIQALANTVKDQLTFHSCLIEIR